MQKQVWKSLKMCRLWL